MSNQSKYENKGDVVNENFCIIPWIHLHTWPNGSVMPCCISDSDYPIGNVKDNTLEELWNSDLQKDTRKKLLNGKRPEICKRCYMQEDMGSGSFRVNANNQWGHYIDQALETTDDDGTNHDFKLLYWDFRFSNACNLKCRMCGPTLSSSWYSDQIKFFGSSETPKALMHVNDISIKDINEYVERFIGDVEEIYFAGGEPLVMEEHYRILEKLIEANNLKCRIRYNTNYTKLKFKDWDVVELWKKFTEVDPNNIQIYASLDGIGKIGEYARKGTNWSVIEDNIKIAVENKFNIHSSTTVSIFNILHMPEFIDRMLELGIPMTSLQLNNVLTFPDYYHMNILPTKLKEEAVRRLDEHLELLDHPEKNWLLDKYEIFKKYLYMEPERNLIEILKDFKNLTEIKDKGREESFVEVYPYYKEWYESL